MQAKQDANK